MTAAHKGLSGMNAALPTKLRAAGGRRLVWGLAFLAIAAALALGWSWLTAVGVASLLVSVLPCVAMCALGLCMNRRTGTPGGTGTACGRHSSQERQDRRVEEER